ncbi:MAG: IS66 family insertion sequence element accessory protein TnpB [Bacteroidota bacterium]|nr:IS66 family insertion sequence element accessory protein TnpB [Bacteroidota bacterium]MDP4252221.1 IS66 family insertion sequence element accessory protein TnpB [Bacteroidota bacterium]
MLHLSPSCSYFLYTGHADMRKSFDGLCGIIKSQMALNALGGSVFIFMNRRRTQVKLLLWEGDGFSIYYKRLEKGTFELPATNSQLATVALDARQLQFILQGVSLRKIVYRPRLQKSA